MQLKCEECGAESYLVVNGRHMTEEQLNRMQYPPRQITRYLNHALWCTKAKNLYQGLERR